MVDKEEPVDVALDIFKHEMKAAEKIQSLFTDLPEEDAIDSMVSGYLTVMDNVDDSDKAESVVGLMVQFAEQMQSEKMMRAALEKADESELVEIDEGVEG